ncbi:hypothetical protein RvY_11704 [Ramazzottius varieornatus]|uniref:MATH domain-containing protein n=1 Tax=Ramazzottius varieornatus TaxID=947166 RepID=A0A1D1VH18_RAMVA|nr:hypothetical protein RvY_11704 [Ramazzottius varieornatus]
MAAQSKMETTISFPEGSSCVINATIRNFPSHKGKAVSISSEEVVVCQSSWYALVYPSEKAPRRDDVDCLAIYMCQKGDKEFEQEYRVKTSFGVVDSGTGRTDKPFTILSLMFGASVRSSNTTKSGDQNHHWFS